MFTLYLPTTMPDFITYIVSVCAFMANAQTNIIAENKILFSTAPNFNRLCCMFDLLFIFGYLLNKNHLIKFLLIINPLHSGSERKIQYLGFDLYL